MKELELDISSDSLAERVASKIEKLIKDNSWEIGAKLPNEFELAASLTVGRGTVREAIKLLSSRNIVEVQRGKGTFVSQQPGMIQDPLGLRFIKIEPLELAADLLEVRLMVEPRIAGLAALNATEEQVAALEHLALVMRQQIETNLSHEENDRAFHGLIAEASQNVVVPNLMPIIQTAVSVLIDVTNNQLNQETIKTHEGIVAAIKAGDALGAEKWMEQHLAYNQQFLADLRQNKA